MCESWGGRLDLFGADEGVAEEEEDAEDPGQGTDFAVAAGAGNLGNLGTDGTYLKF